MYRKTAIALAIGAVVAPTANAADFQINGSTVP